MRIVHWTESYYPNIGGMEVFAQNLALSLRDTGHECIILTDTYGQFPAEEMMDKLKIYRFGFRGALGTKNMPEILHTSKAATRLLNQIKPDLIHLHTSQYGAFFFLRSQTGLNFPSIYTSHDPLLDLTESNSMFSQIISRVNRIAAVSDFMKNGICDKYPQAADKISLILNACPAPKARPDPLPISPPIFLGLGRMLPEKGFDLLLESFAVLQKESDARLILAGDGAEKKALISRVKELGIMDKVECTGWIHPQNVPDIINQSSCVVVPSRWNEPFGLVALQAMQMGRPVIAAKIGGLPEIVKDNLHGHLFEADNITSLQSAMRMIMQNPDKTIQMGKAAHQCARDEFPWDQLISRYSEVYQELAS